MRSRRAWSILSIAVVIPSILSNAAALSQSDSTWRQFSAAGDSARIHGDWKGYRHYAELLYRDLNGHPGTILAQARAEAQLHDTAAAMKWLKLYAATGLVKDLDADSLLAPVRGAPGWRELLARIAKNREAVSHAKVAFTVPDSAFVSEDIAYDAARKRFLLSSIREGRIIAIKNGKITTFAEDSGGRSMMALVVDEKNGALWASASGLPEAEDSLAWDGTEVLRYDLATGKLLATYAVEADSGTNVYGDMTQARDGSIWFTNSVGGQLYTIHAPADSFRMVVTDGAFRRHRNRSHCPMGSACSCPTTCAGSRSSNARRAR